MANWFYAANGQQQGPYPEAQFRDLIGNGTVRGDTLVWTEGMAGWQKAIEVPGLMPPGPPPPSMGAPSPVMATTAGGMSGDRLWIDFGIWDFVWRALLFLLGCILLIPIPWVTVWFTKWLVSCVHVPGRPNLTFTGTPMTIAVWVFGAIALGIVIAIAAYWTEIDALNNLGYLIQIVLYWLFLKWLVANLASNGQPLGLSFSGSFWGFLGYSILAAISFITIIGWAWVYVAMARWMCRNIRGTRREIVFVGTGLDLLWRAIVAVIGMCFIIPIPWVYRWMLRWWASNTQLVARGAGAGM